MGPKDQAVVDRLARVSELEFCEHDPENVGCAACGEQAGDPAADAIAVLRVAAWLGAHFYLCQSCTAQDLPLAEHEPS